MTWELTDHLCRRCGGRVLPRAYRHFGGMCWAVPGERMDELAYALTFAPEGHAFTLSERLTIRSFLDCYRELVALPEKTRNRRVREIRKGPG
jgi:hypothetical protein